MKGHRFHNLRDRECWLASVKGQVFNVTDWIKQHCGWDIPLLNLNGQEATDAFIAFHPGIAWQHLDNLFTGYYLEDSQVYEVSRDYRKPCLDFAIAGLCKKKGHGVIYLFCFIGFLLFLTFYVVIFSDNLLIHMLFGELLRLTWMQISYLGHDSGHFLIMTNKGFNKMIQIMSEKRLSGIHITWWKWTHNAHYVACNSLDYDPHLQHLPVFTVSSSLFKSLNSTFYGRELTFDSLEKIFVSYQHFMFYPIFCVSWVNLFVQLLLLLLFSRRKVPNGLFNMLGNEEQT
ncbi:delta(8)-fatty-acid desaturase-like [Solanum verrucosum]|uniref:delta(8)-fatty-acid desaturase-like n=1 Tax=Solanum verrucosum TaxID=315347 RepID=UPI0020D1EBD8|nr:delta(8)-fatty-acid desaturase-like [Solanum verrucosum]